ncbi:MAG TPA: hypothetical protein PKC18_10100, partial [Lacipirellulaceae bacterium]|nr:hypothetical protein [Lacipirellulaceae bacterium]
MTAVGRARQLERQEAQIIPAEQSANLGPWILAEGAGRELRKSRHKRRCQQQGRVASLATAPTL